MNGSRKKKDKVDPNAEVIAFWENILKPKWETSARLRGEKLLAELIENKKASKTKKIAEIKRIKPGKKKQLIIQINGNQLNVRCNFKTENEKRGPKKGPIWGPKKAPK